MPTPAEGESAQRARPRRRWWPWGVVVGSVAVVIWTVGSGFMGSKHAEVISPSDADLEVVSQGRIFFGHQSVGANLIAGLGMISEDAGIPLRISESNGGPPSDGGTVAHAAVGVNGEPETKIDEFVALIDAGIGGSVDVALLKFCYVDVTAATDIDALLASYTEMVETLQARYPGSTFLYATVPLTRERDLKETIKAWFGRGEGVGPEDNVAREKFNAALRERLDGTGLLFDIAAVESRMELSGAQHTHGGETYYALDDAWASDPGHLNDAGSRAVAGEFVRVIAAALAQR